MSDTTVIKEFLVSLGFKKDEASLQKFQDGVDAATTSVFRLAAAIGGTALTVAIGVERFANNLEKLYFASQRTGTSATSIKAFSRAIQDFGGTADGALSSIEGLARFIRENPIGGPAIIGAQLAQVGRHYTGDPEKDLESLGLVFARNTRNKQGGMNYLLAGQFGIDEKTMLALQNGQLAARLETLQDRLKAAGFEKAAKDAHDFMMDLRDLGDYLVIFGTMVQDALQQKFGISMHQVVEYVSTHMPEMRDKVMHAIDTITTVIDGARETFGWLWGIFKKLDDASGGWVGKLAALLLTLRLLGATSLVTGLLSLAAAFVRLGAGITAAAAASASATAAGGGLARLLGLVTRGGLAVGAGVGLGALLNELAPDNWLAQLGRKGTASQSNWFDRRINAVNWLDRYSGLGHEQNLGIVAALERESNLNPGAVGDHGEAFGIGQWHAPRQALFKQWSGHDIRDRPDLEEQVRFVVYELQHGDSQSRQAYGWLHSGTDNAPDAAEFFDRLFLRPKDVEGAVARDRDRAIHLHAESHVIIDGSKDVQATKQAVKEAQEETYSDLTRHFVPVLR